VPTHRYPVLVVRDSAGGFTALAVEPGDLAGFGATAAAARDDLKGYLEWAHRSKPRLPDPDFLAVRRADRPVEHVARVGFDARYGARPLQRTIEREVVAALAG
jgi:C-terminal, D2-small domain, of ClpB protein